MRGYLLANHHGSDFSHIGEPSPPRDRQILSAKAHFKSQLLLPNAASASNYKPSASEIGHYRRTAHLQLTAFPPLSGDDWVWSKMLPKEHTRHSVHSG